MSADELSQESPPLATAPRATEAGRSSVVIRVDGQDAAVIRIEGPPAQSHSTDMGKQLSVAGTLAVATGVLYNVGYFAGFDLKFFALLSYEDHLTALVSFAGPCLLLALLWLWLRQLGRKPESPAGDPAPADLAAVGLLMFIFIAWICSSELTRSFLNPTLVTIAGRVMGLCSFLLTGYVIAVIFDFVASGKISTSGSQAQKSIGPFAILFILVILFILLVIKIGNATYHADVGGKQFDAEITFAPQDTGEGRSRPVHIVCTIENGFFLVLKDDPDHVVFVKKDAVRTISRKVAR